MNKLRALLFIAVVLSVISGCDGSTVKENISDSDTTKIESISIEEDIIDSDIEDNVTDSNVSSYQFIVGFTDVNEFNKVEIIEDDNYDNSLNIYDEGEQVIYESRTGELPGKIREICIVDFNEDELEDILVVLDLGGSGGVYEYQLYSYDESNVILSDFETLSSENKFEVNIEDESAIVTFKESGEFERIEFSEEVYSMLDSLDISSARNYIWGSQIISHYFDNNSELILVSRSQLMIEHKLLVVAEAEVEYIKRDNEWIVIEWDVIVKSD